MELIERIKEYEASTKVFLDAVAEMDMAKIDSHAEGGWTARQVIHHVADSEAQSYARLRRLLAEPAGSIIQGYDEAAWAQCPELGITLGTTSLLVLLITGVASGLVWIGGTVGLTPTHPAVSIANINVITNSLFIVSPLLWC